MPCRCDDFLPEPRKIKTKTEHLERARDWLEAALCAVLTHNLESNGEEANDALLSELDYNEAGITEAELRTWWTEHQAKDQARRLKERALSKLTPEEKKALGLV